MAAGMQLVNEMRPRGKDGRLVNEMRPRGKDGRSELFAGMKSAPHSATGYFTRESDVIPGLTRSLRRYLITDCRLG